MWQITFDIASVADSIADSIADAIGEAVAAGAVSLHRDGDDEPWQVSILTDTAPDKGRIAQALADASTEFGVGTGALVLEKLPQKNWLEENIKDFPPIDIGAFTIHTTHHKTAVGAGRIGVLIEAGLAFGTGRHGSTKGCVLMLEKYIATAKSIADIGCGSGILAIAAAKLTQNGSQPCSIIAVDNDPVAVAVAEANCVANDVGHRVQCGEADGYRSALIEAHTPFDIICANILPTPLMDMAAEAAQNLTEAGVLIVAGLMEKHREAVIAKHRSHGLGLCDSLTCDGWVTLVFKRGEQ